MAQPIRNPKAILLAAGLGTRLRPLTNSIAKPSLPILGIPALWYNAWNMKNSFGISNIAVNVSHASDSMDRALQDLDLMRETGLSFYRSDETSQILGTSGAIGALRSWIGNNPMIVQNSDTICPIDWPSFWKSHQQSGAKLSLHLLPMPKNGNSYTDIVVDASGKIVRLDPLGRRGLMFSGAYIAEPSVLDMIPDGPSEFVDTLLKPLIQKGKVFGWTKPTPWFDIGTLGTYSHTQFELVREAPVYRNLVELKMVEVNQGCWIPKTWGVELETLHLSSPVVFFGSQEKWLHYARTFGPHFIGLEPPTSFSTEPKSSNVLIFGDFSYPIH